MARPYPTNLPDPYALEHVAKAVGWDDDARIGPYLRAYWPQVFQGIGVEAAYGFSVNGGPNENTAESEGHASMSEVGMLGVTDGPWQLVTPNCDRSASNDWCLNHAAPEVVAMLGRAACMEANCWRLSVAGTVADQVAVGIVSLAKNGLSLMRRLPPEVWPSTTGLWFMALASMGWSAGSAGAEAHLRPYLAQLAAAPEEGRFALWQRLIALAGYDRSLGGSADSHSNPAYTLVRTAQKLRTALFLGDRWAARGGSPALWACSIEPDADAQRWVDAAVALRASGLSPRTRGLPAPDPGWWTAANYGILTSELSGR